MADLVRDHIRLRKLAGFAAAAAEALLDFTEEGRIQEDDSLRWTVEWSHGRLRGAALARPGLIGKQHKFGCAVSLPALPENVLPCVLGAAEHRGDELAGFIGRCSAAGLPARLHLLFVLRIAAAEDFSATDQDPRVDAERPTDDAEHHDGADTKAAAADGNAEATPTTATA